MGGNMCEGSRKPTQGFFVIVFEGRTGSSYTVSCLNSHLGIFCYPEILSRQSGEVQKQILKTLVDGRGVENLPRVHVNPRYFHSLPEDLKSFQVVGFKTKLHDVQNLIGFYDYLCRYQFRVIYLKRRNVIKSAISMLNAHRLVKKFGDAHWNASDKKQVQGAFHVSPDALLVQLQERIRVEKWHQDFFDLYDGQKKVFFYEDLLKNEKQFFAHMLAFLGVEKRSLSGRFLKNTPNRLSDAILNYDEIRDVFLNTYFERFFDDEPN